MDQAEWAYYAAGRQYFALQHGFQTIRGLTGCAVNLHPEEEVVFSKRWDKNAAAQRILVAKFFLIGPIMLAKWMGRPVTFGSCYQNDICRSDFQKAEYLMGQDFPNESERLSALSACFDDISKELDGAETRATIERWKASFNSPKGDVPASSIKYASAASPAGFVLFLIMAGLMLVGSGTGDILSVVVEHGHILNKGHGRCVEVAWPRVLTSAIALSIWFLIVVIGAVATLISEKQNRIFYVGLALFGLLAIFCIVVRALQISAQL